jgi:carbon starvation protein
VVTVGLTIPIAFIMGGYMRWIRPHAVLEATAIGLVLLVVALFAGQWVSESATWAPRFTLSQIQLAWLVMGYGVAASVLPVWLLLAPRDYLSAFVKIGVVFVLAAGILIMLPPLQMPKLTQFIDGTGPVFAGKLFPFAFITIACGAISGFHSLVSSGTTPKLLISEPDARFIGYGAMLMESLVGIMALIAACVLTPGVYFAINAPAGLLGTIAASAAAAIQGWGFAVSPAEIEALATQVGESSMLSRTGGAPSLAVGMAHIFANALSGGSAMAIWYHFAIMFEALFILTVVDAGTRVGRFMLQDMGKYVWEPFGRVSWYPAVILSSVIFVAMWGWFLIGGVRDPLGGINSLWPLFGIANQLLACVALCVATTIIVKMGKARYMWVTILPLLWLGTVTMTAASQKVWHPAPNLGFLAQASRDAGILATGALPPGAPSIDAAQTIIFNARLNAGVALFFMVSVVVVIAASAMEWFAVISGRKAAVSSEVPYEPKAAAAFGD